MWSNSIELTKIRLLIDPHPDINSLMQVSSYHTFFSMRPILCVIDLTEASVKVIEVAARMTYAFKSQMIILFPYRLIEKNYTGEISQMKMKLEQQAEEKFAELKKQIVMLDQVSYEFIPEIGFSYDRISSYVKRTKVDAVVIGQRQANAINELNTLALQTLISNSKLPFTIVPEETDVVVL